MSYSKEVEMHILTMILIGLAAGVLSVMLGVGGGILIVPALTFFAGMDMKVATGTSLAVIIPTAVMGTLQRSRAHQVDWRVSLLVAIGAVAGAYLGAQLVSLTSDLTLRRLFALLLLFTAVRMLLSKH